MKKKKNYEYVFYFSMFLICLLIMILSTLYELNIFDLIKNYYSNNIKAESLMLYLKEKINENNYGFDYIIIWGTNIFQCIVPFFGIIAIYKFQNVLKKFDLKKNIIISLKMSLAIFSAYVIYYLLVIFLFKGLYSEYISGEIFLDIFGRNFYYNHIYLYYLLDGLVRFLFIPFLYSIFGIILNQIISKKIICSYLLIAYYYGFSLFALILKEFIGNSAIYFSPSTIMCSNIYENINTILLILNNILPVLFIYILYYIKNKKEYKLTNCFKNKIIYIIIYVVLVGLSSIMLSITNEYAESTIVTLYNNVGFFLIYLYFSNSLIFCIYNKSDVSIKKIIIINLFICIFQFVFNFVLLKLFYFSFDIKLLFYLNCNLFMLLVIISLCQYAINYKNEIKDCWLLMCLFSFIYMIKYIYIKNFLFINLFDYYFVNDKLHFPFFHYIFWIVFPIIVILFKKLNKFKKDNGVVI